MEALQLLLQLNSVCRPIKTEHTKDIRVQLQEY
jgi:hypothetical protein